MLIAIFESLYLIYMFCFFETSIDFNIFSSPDGKWFKHLIGNKKGNRICSFGHITIFFLIGLILFRELFPKALVTVSFVIAFLISLLNLNVLVYLIPIFVIEYYK